MSLKLGEQKSCVASKKLMGFLKLFEVGGEPVQSSNITCGVVVTLEAILGNAGVTSDLPWHCCIL
jgi:hypothetical protein